MLGLFVLLSVANAVLTGAWSLVVLGRRFGTARTKLTDDEVLQSLERWAEQCDDNGAQLTGAQVREAIRHARELAPAEVSP